MAKTWGWIAGLAALAWAGAASAQEGLPEGLQWGWTPEQLMTASPDLRRARRGDPIGGARTLAEGPVRLADLDLTARYYFKDGGLLFVRVDVPYRRCRDALTALGERYGEPLIIADQVILKSLIWHDEAQDRRPVLMVSQAGICALSLYRLGEYRDHDLAEVAAGHARPPA